MDSDAGHMRNVLHAPGSPTEYWTTDVVGEAAPGVLSPLCWSIWGGCGDRVMRRVARNIGVMTRAECSPKGETDSYYSIFYGRCATRVDYMALLGDRLPGTSGEAAVTGLLGRAPSDLEYRPTKRRYPAVALCLPFQSALTPRRVRAAGAGTDSWWRNSVRQLATASLEEAVALFDQGARRFEEAMYRQSIVLLAVVQPLYEAMSTVVEQTGTGDLAVLSGTGGPEMAIIGDLLRASRGEIDIADIVREHGFHGPLEGELSSAVWREDDGPLRRLVEHYAAKSEAEDPRVVGAGSRQDLVAMRRAVVAAVPPRQRPATRILLNLAGSRILLRGVAKRSYLQSFDVARAAARRVGEHLARDGALEGRDDVFYLLAEELRGPVGHALVDIAAERRKIRAEYQRLAIPSSWQGVPTPIRDVARAAGPDSTPATLSGIGVSAGTVDGVVRVVTDPATDDIEPGEILVAATTDPSWSAVMFVSSALLVDIGGQLSHAAVVARELRIPCVVNLRTATSRLRSGDRVRVDGSRGTVEILDRIRQPMTPTP